MNIGFDKISPTPQYPYGINAVQLSTYDWSSKAGVVLQFKAALKADLRTAQLGRCCYCRRLLFDDISTHIEHFVEKAQHPLFTFEIKNLALSCGTCNTQKNGKNNLLASLIKKRAERQGKSPSPRCLTLAQELEPNATLPNDPQHYRWVHPHLDKYSDNIQIRKGWVFVGKTPKGSPKRIPHPDHQCPTKTQFKYWGRLRSPGHEVWKKQFSPRALARIDRVLFGSANESIVKIGQRGAIDSTTTDQELVSVINRLNRIGQAHRVLIVDGKYKYIPGFYMGLDAPGSLPVQLWCSKSAYKSCFEQRLSGLPLRLYRRVTFSLSQRKLARIGQTTYLTSWKFVNTHRGKDK